MAAGVSERSVYRHFPDVESLVHAAIDRRVEVMAPLSDLSVDPDAPLAERVGHVAERTRGLLRDRAPAPTLHRPERARDAAAGVAGPGPPGVPARPAAGRVRAGARGTERRAGRGARTRSRRPRPGRRGSTCARTRSCRWPSPEASSSRSTSRRSCRIRARHDVTSRAEVARGHPAHARRPLRRPPRLRLRAALRRRRPSGDGGELRVHYLDEGPADGRGRAVPARRAVVVASSTAT